MKTRSIWEETKTFFPLFLHVLATHCEPDAPVCVIGAADGKFVVPLAERGWSVVAIELDHVALFGGEVMLPGQGVIHIPGLSGRLKQEGLEQYVTIIEGDLLTCELLDPCPAVFTSCSWHYSRNHTVPIAAFIERMQSLVASGGIFAAEYMMPSEERHLAIEHYVKEGQLARYFRRGWTIIEDLYTGIFAEKAHVGNPIEHSHRMGFFVAKKNELEV